jgi:hypothetical protein
VLGASYPFRETVESMKPFVKTQVLLCISAIIALTSPEAFSSPAGGGGAPHAGSGKKTRLGQCMDTVDDYQKACESRCLETTAPADGGGAATDPQVGGKLSNEEEVQECFRFCDKEVMRMRAACYKNYDTSGVKK